MFGATVDTRHPGGANPHASAADRYPSPATVEALASELVRRAPFLFTGKQLVDAFADWTVDGALIFEDGRGEVIDAAWNALGLRNPDRVAEEVADPDGWAMWTAHCAVDGALLLLVQRQAAWEWGRLSVANCDYLARA